MIGSKLVELRTLHNMSQQELASMLRVNVKSVKNWERDFSDPCLSSLKALSEIFNVSTDELLGSTLADSISLSRLSVEDQNKLKRAIMAYIAEATKNS